MEEYYNIKFLNKTYCNFITISYKKDKNTTHCQVHFITKLFINLILK